MHRKIYSVFVSSQCFFFYKKVFTALKSYSYIDETDPVCCISTPAGQRTFSIVSFVLHINEGFFKLTAAGGCKDVLINKCTHTHISDINIRTPNVQELMWKQCRNNWPIGARALDRWGCLYLILWASISLKNLNSIWIWGADSLYQHLGLFAKFLK